MRVKELSDRVINKGINTAVIIVNLLLYVFVGLTVYVLVEQLSNFNVKGNIPVYWNLFFVFPPLYYFAGEVLRRLKFSRSKKKWNAVFLFHTFLSYIFSRAITIIVFFISTHLLINQFPDLELSVYIVLFVFDLIVWFAIKDKPTIKNAPILWKMILFNVLESILIVPFSFVAHLLFNWISM